MSIVLRSRKTLVQRAISYLRKLNTSPANINDANGWMQRPGNLLLNSATPATQSVTCTAQVYTLALIGTGSVALSGTASGTLTGTGAPDLVVLTFTPTAGSVTFTKSGSVTSFGLFAGTLTASKIIAMGGIPLTTSAASVAEYTRANVLDFGVAQGALAYAATHTAAEFLTQYPLWHLYQDTAGTVPACKITDPVGMVLDTGSGGVVLGPELVANGGFDSDTAWTKGAGWSIAGGVAVATAVTSGKLSQINISVGKTYLISVNVVSFSGDTYTIYAGTSNSGNMTGIGVKTAVLSPTVNGTLALSSWSGSGLNIVIDNISVREVIGAHASQTTPTKRALLDAAGSSVFDGIDDVLTTTTGGASSTSVFLCMAFNTSRSGSAQTLWSDRTGNTGLKLEITAANALVLSGGNGSAIVTATGGTVTANAPHIATAKYDGTTLSVQLDSGTVATAACALSAGTAVVTIGMDNGAVTAPYKGVLRQCTYIKDSLPTAGEQLLIRQATAASIGVTL